MPSQPQTKPLLEAPSRFVICQTAARYGITPIEANTGGTRHLIWVHDRSGRSFTTHDWPTSQPELLYLCSKFNHLLAQHEPQAQ